MKHWPREIRRWVSQVGRHATDTMTGQRRKFVSPSSQPIPDNDVFQPRITLEQRIIPIESAAAKIHNLNCAAARLQNLTIKPDDIISFWRVVGRPSKTNGFQRGRSLLGGRLQLDYGGGLCQLSGLLYQLSLQAGLTILERHPHSHDIYRTQERYAPLGADATVAYGFKDLRILNPTKAAICFRVTITSEKISLQLYSPIEITSQPIEFVPIREDENFCTVETRRQHRTEQHYEVIAISTYRVLPLPGYKRAA